MVLDCRYCSKKFRTIPSLKNKRKYCSCECKAKAQIGVKFSSETKKKMSLSRKGREFTWGHKIAQALRGRPKSEEHKKKLRDARKRQQIPLSLTTPEKRFRRLVKKYNLPFKYAGDGSFWVGRCNPDFVSNNDKKAIDIFGDYWHNNPRTPWFQTEYGRKKYFARHGWKLTVIWEHELDELSEKEIINRISMMA